MSFTNFDSARQALEESNMGWLQTFLGGESEDDGDGVADDPQAELDACEADIARLCEHVRLQSGLDGQQDSRMVMLEAENGELKLYLAAVIRMMIARGVATREEFARLVDVVDRSDGLEDGQFGGDIAQHRTWTGEEGGRAGGT